MQYVHTQHVIVHCAITTATNAANFNLYSAFQILTTVEPMNFISIHTDLWVHMGKIQTNCVIGESNCVFYESNSPEFYNFCVQQFISFSLFWHPMAHIALGMPLNRKRKHRSENEAEKKYNYMNCRAQKWNPDSPMLRLEQEHCNDWWLWPARLKQ